ncbi:MAG TPA: hypothetical protein VIO33_06600 [Burkholderiaceae bacterium]
MLRLAVAVGLMPAAGWAAAPATDAPPAAGRYTAQLCVATSPAGPSCGPADVELRANGAARVRVADIVYQLQLNSSQVEVVLMQGTMQLDEFVTNYEWVGRSLQFVDKEKNARYEVRLGELRR